MTIDRQCGSSQQAVHFAAQAVLSGTADLIVAGGVQNMSAVPIMSAMIAGQQLGFETPFAGAVGWEKRYGDPATNEISQFRGADMIAERWDIPREAMEEFALESHRRALAAIGEGRFANEIVPFGDVATDEGPRTDTSLEKMAALPTLRAGGRITAAVSSQISDAASAALRGSLRRGCAGTDSPRGPGCTTYRCAPTTRCTCSPRRSARRSTHSARPA